MSENRTAVLFDGDDLQGWFKAAHLAIVRDGDGNAQFRSDRVTIVYNQVLDFISEEHKRIIDSNSGIEEGADFSKTPLDENIISNIVYFLYDFDRTYAKTLAINKSEDEYGSINCGKLADSVAMRAVETLLEDFGTLNFILLVNYCTLYDRNVLGNFVFESEQVKVLLKVYETYAELIFEDDKYSKEAHDSVLSLPLDWLVMISNSNDSEVSHMDVNMLVERAPF